MDDEKRTTKDQFIEIIIRERLGSSYQDIDITISKTVGPYFPNAFYKYVVSKKAVRIAFTEHLDKFEFNELALRFDGHGKSKSNALSDMKFWSETLFDFAGDVNKSEPVWIEGGFGHPKYLADVNYWSKMVVFNFDELLLLSVGVDPNKTKVVDIYNLGQSGGENAWQVINFLSNRNKLLDRRFNPTSKPEAKIKPVEFLDFVDFVNLPVETSFLNALRKIHQPAKQKEIIDPREKTSLLNLIAVMANDAYRYDPSIRSAVPSEIYDAAKMNGIKISKETIRNHLKNAVGPLTERWLTK